MRRTLVAFLFVVFSAVSLFAVSPVPKDAKVFIEPMDGFEVALTAAFLKKETPVKVVDSKDNADFIITGTSSVKQAGWAKTIFYSPAPSASASIQMKGAKDGVVVFAYNVDKSSAARGQQSTAEACAKHLKQFMEKK